METTCSVIVQTSVATVTSTQTILVTSTDAPTTQTVTDASGTHTTAVAGTPVTATLTSLVPVPTTVTNTISSCVGVTTATPTSTTTTAADTPTTSTTSQAVDPGTTSTMTTIQAQTSTTNAAVVTTSRTANIPNTSVMNSFGVPITSTDASSSIILPAGAIAASSSKSSAGPIAGGVIGGIAAFLIIAGLLFFGVKRTRQKRALAEQDDFYRINGHDGNRETVFTAGGFPGHSRNTSVLPSRPGSPPLNSEGYPQQSLVASVYDPQFGSQAGYGMPQDGYDSASAYGSMNDQTAAAALSGAAGAGIGAYYAQQQYAQAMEQQQGYQNDAQYQQAVQYPPHAHYDPAVYGHDNSQAPQQAEYAAMGQDSQNQTQARPQSTMPNPWSPSTQTNFNNNIGGPMPAVPGPMAQARPIGSIPPNMQSEAWRDSYGSVVQETPPRMLGVANPDTDRDSIRSGRQSPTKAQL